MQALNVIIMQKYINLKKILQVKKSTVQSYIPTMITTMTW